MIRIGGLFNLGAAGHGVLSCWTSGAPESNKSSCLDMDKSAGLRSYFGSDANTGHTGVLDLFRGFRLRNVNKSQNSIGKLNRHL